ncbi:MAG: hypothetical protein PWP15_573 [Methanothermococcus sp.]|jgi:hypothetical protein|nr:hypothetical protein [Methanothermococcus sp.]MDK2987118.1 hypothetical protein [Methanothermococcus sp.]
MSCNCGNGSNTCGCKKTEDIACEASSLNCNHKKCKHETITEQKSCGCCSRKI